MANNYFTGKTLLITGGTGSFGNTVLKHFLATDIGEIRIFSRDEKKQDDMRHQIQQTHPELAGKLREYRSVEADLRDELLHTAACKAAVKGGMHLTPEEQRALVEQVMTDDDVRYCPHGRPVAVYYSKYQLEKQFKRIQ